MWTREVHNSARPVLMQAGQTARSLQATLSTLLHLILESLQDRRVKRELTWQKVRWMCTHYPLLPLLFPQPHELFVLPGDKVNGRVLQQGGKHKQETHGHPDIDGLHVGHLEKDRRQMRRSLIAVFYSSCAQWPTFATGSWPTAQSRVTAKTWGMPWPGRSCHSKSSTHTEH